MDHQYELPHLSQNHALLPMVYTLLKLELMQRAMCLVGGKMSICKKVCVVVQRNT